MKVCFFPLWQQILSLIFLDVTVSPDSFSRKYMPNAEIWITLVFYCQSFFLVKVLFHEQGACLLWDKHHTFIFSRSALCVHLISLCRILQRHILKGQDLIKLAIIFALLRTFSRKNKTGNFLKLSYVCEDCNDYQYILVLCLNSC